MNHRTLLEGARDAELRKVEGEDSGGGIGSPPGTAWAEQASGVEGRRGYLIPRIMAQKAS